MAENRSSRESETARLTRNGNGALLRWNKHGLGAPEHVGFAVHDRRSWEEHIRPYLLDERTYERRLDFASYRSLRGAKCSRQELFMTCGVVGPFDLDVPHVRPRKPAHRQWGSTASGCTKWRTYTLTVAIRLLEILFCPGRAARWALGLGGSGFQAPALFMSPAMYKALIYPAHKKLSRVCPQLRAAGQSLHCDGYVERVDPGV